MKILDLLQDLLVEEMWSDELLRFLIDKWNSNTPENEQIASNEIERINTWFNSISDGLFLEKNTKKLVRKLPDGSERPATKDEQLIIQRRRTTSWTENGENFVFEAKKIKTLNKKVFKFLEENPDFLSDLEITSLTNLTPEEKQKIDTKLKNIRNYSLNQIKNLKNIFESTDSKKNDELIEVLFKKWNLTDKEEKETVKNIIEWFNKIKDNLVEEKEVTKYIDSRTRESISSDVAFDDGVLKPGVVEKKLKIKTPQIVQFKKLNPHFKNENLKQITNYSKKEIIDLIRSFREKFFSKNEPNVDVDLYQELMNNFKEGGFTKKTDNKIKLSYRDLWCGKHDLIYENNGFRVYSIKDAAESIAFGYFLGFVANKLNGIKNKLDLNTPESTGSFPQWCVTNASGNLYRTYRETKDRTFYFIIDDSKSPFDGDPLNGILKDNLNSDNVNYLVALQPTPSGSFHFSNITNPHPEPTLSLNKIFEIFPKLNNVLENNEKVINLIKPKKYNSSEDNSGQTETQSILSQIQDVNPNGQYYFLSQSVTPEMRMAFAMAGGSHYIHQVDSWDIMDDQMRIEYIANTDAANFTSRFSNYDLLKAVLVTNENDLKNRLRLVDLTTETTNGLTVLNKAIIQRDYRKYHWNIKNKKLNIWETTNNPKRFGILDENTFEWLMLENGVVYDPPYEQYSFHFSNYTENVDDDFDTYWVSIYKKHNTPESEFFVEIQNVMEDQTIGELYTYDHWKKYFEPFLENAVDPETGEKVKETFNATKDLTSELKGKSNINENKKRRV